MDIEKQNELADLSVHIFNQKQINSGDILNLIEQHTTSKFDDSTSYAQIYDHKSADTYFKVMMDSIDNIIYISYYRSHKEINTAEYYDNGMIMCKFNITREGIRQGRFECYYKNGTLNSEGTYKDDKRVGLETEYDSIGNIINQYDYD